MTRYRLYTERFDNVPAIASKYFDGFTVYHTVGYWQGTAEDSVVVEVLTDEHAKVSALARELRKTNDQQAVLVTSEPVTVEWALNQGDDNAPTSGPLGDVK